jgi:hypothetical protein
VASERTKSKCKILIDRDPLGNDLLKIRITDRLEADQLQPRFEICRRRKVRHDLTDLCVYLGLCWRLTRQPLGFKREKALIDQQTQRTIEIFGRRRIVRNARLKCELPFQVGIGDQFGPAAVTNRRDGFIDHCLTVQGKGRRDEAKI